MLTQANNRNLLTDADLRDLKILVYGLGTTGLSVLRFLLKRQDQVFLYQDGAWGPKDEQNLAQNFPQDRDRIQVLGQGGPVDLSAALQGFDLVIKSPGIHLDRPLLQAAAALGLPVISDIDLAYRYHGPDLIAITGSNGKTTTTALIAHILSESGIPAHACGNIGLAVLDAIGSYPAEDQLVVECSSYQLASSPAFAPHLALLLNLSPDHLEYHGSYENYIACKFKIASQQGPDDLFFINGRDQDTQAYLRTHPLASRVMTLDPEDAISAHIRNLPGFPLLGDFNVENARFAYAVAQTLGLTPGQIDRALVSFQPVAHRMEQVRVLDGVTYINDSKGTNVDATVKALGAVEGPVLLIAGGYDKQVPFDDLYPAFARQGKWLILLGQTQDQLAREATAYGLGDKVVRVASLKEAVAQAYQRAERGDVVLLSPASASWDMYRRFEDRGDEFKDLVRHLPAGQDHEA